MCCLISSPSEANAQTCTLSTQGRDLVYSPTCRQIIPLYKNKDIKEWATDSRMYSKYIIILFFLSIIVSPVRSHCLFPRFFLLPKWGVRLLLSLRTILLFLLLWLWPNVCVLIVVYRMVDVLIVTFFLSPTSTMYAQAKGGDI